MRWIVIGFLWVALSTFVLLDWLTPAMGSSTRIRYIIFFVDSVFFLLTLKFVWTQLWRFVPYLNNWFPDLNGEYDVELRHNWPIQQKMLEAASGDEKFDPRLADANIPSLGVTHLRGSIDLGFYSVHIKMWSENPNEIGSVIDQSRTLATSLLRPCDGNPSRIVYVYQQKNRRERQQVTDDSTFEGAAVIDVPKGKVTTLRGEYWTNRSWQQGLSTAGTITFKKRR
jgi:hypothetical protein